MYSLRTLVLVGLVSLFLLVSSFLASISSPTVFATHSVNDVIFLEDYVVKSSQPLSNLNLVALLLNESVNVTNCSFSFQEAQTKISGDSCIINHTFYFGSYSLNVSFTSQDTVVSKTVLLNVVKEDDFERTAVPLTRRKIDNPVVIVIIFVILLLLIFLFAYFRKQEEKVRNQLHDLDHKINILFNKK